MSDKENTMKKILDDNKSWIDDTWSKIETKLKRVCMEAKDKITTIIAMATSAIF